MKAKLWHRLLAGLCCLAMVLSAMPLSGEGIRIVANAEDNSSTSTLPEMKKDLWLEGFEDTELSYKVGNRNDDSQNTIEVDTEDQVLRMTRTTNVGYLYQNIYFDINGAVSGVYALEFNIKKSQNAVLNVQIIDDNKKKPVQDVYGADGTWTINYYDTVARSDKKSEKVELDKDIGHKVTYLIDTNNSTVSVWVDDQRKVETGYTLVDAANGLQYVRFQLEANNCDEDAATVDASVEIDNIHFYEVYPMTAAERLALDEAWLTADSLVDSTDALWENEKISLDLNLPTAGDNKSVITWNSSDASVISNEGKVIRGTEDKTVNLTATIKATGVEGDTAESTKEITFTVAADSSLVASTLPEMKQNLWLEGFEDTELNYKYANTISDSQNTIKVDTETQVLCMNRTTKTGSLYQNIYFDADKAARKGVYALEFNIKKSAGTVLKMQIQDGTNKVKLVNDVYGADGTWTINYYDTAARSDKKSEKVELDEAIAHKVTYLIDTNNSTVSVWVDGQRKVKTGYTLVDAATGLLYVRIMLAQDNCDTDATTVDASVEIDDIHFYEVYPMTAAERLALDEAWLTRESLVNTEDIYWENDQISLNLNLPETGDNKSQITWSSSNKDVISDAGVVVRGEEEQTVTLTATIKATGVEGDTAETTKDFTFAVASNKVLTDEEAVNKVSEYLTKDVISPLDDASDGIIRSLSLPVYNDIYGCTISWTSGNEAYITESGRVIRPRWNEEDVEVTLTCTISKGECQKTNTYTFRVLAELEFEDPEHMTDEEFFGVWDAATSTWTTVGKFDYDYEGLEELEAAVKAAGTGGDYTAAKAELLDYFVNDRTQEAVVSSTSINSLWADATIDGFQFFQNGKHCSGQMIFGTEWKQYTANLSLKDINVSPVIAYNLQAWYNEDSAVEIARSTAADESMRPKLELVIDGVTHTFTAVEDALIKSGSYANQNFNDVETLELKTYGNFLDDGHSRALIKFNLDGVTSDDVVTEARLILYGRVKGAGEEKTVFIGYEPDTTWSADTIKWKGIEGLLYSFNGFGDSNEADSGVSAAGRWEIVEGSIVNYANQNPRFECWNAIASEYLSTGNDKYIYSAIRIMESFVRDRGGWTSKTSKFERTEPDPDPAALRGGYPCTLSASIRVVYWLDTLPLLVESEYANADFLTAILKNLWDTGNYLTVYNTKKSGNWKQYEMTGLLDLGTRLPEFYDAQQGKNWQMMGQHALEELLFDFTFEDGSYQESSEAYGSAVVRNYNAFKESLQAAGNNTSEAFDERLNKLALYQALLYANDGSSAQYGDSADTTRDAAVFEPIYTWFNDEELEYIITYGASGTEPDWTSKCFFDSGVTTMRSDWSKEGIWMFTNVRGGGNHGHKDYNAIVLHAFGRRLLIDSGYFVYDSSNDYTIYGKSTEGHNTVMINDTSQNSFYNEANQVVTYGTVYDFDTNDAYDYLEQSTPNTPGYEHRRSITFIKSGLVIVSDLMTPENTENSNNYKQLWHLPLESNFIISAEDLTIRSAYESGGNIALAIAKEDGVTVDTAPGWRCKTYGRVEDAPYAYFELDGAGVQTMDTVLLVTEDDPTASVTAEKLESRENTTAMKFNMVTKDGTFTGYYLQSYDGEGGNFGPFATDAHTAYVLLDAEGNVKEMLFNGGTYIRYTENGASLVEATEEQEALFVDLTGSVDYLAGSIVYLTGDEETIDSVKVLAQDDCLGIVVNDAPCTYDTVGGYITNIGTGASSTEENLPPLEIILEGTDTSYQNDSGEDISIHCTGDLEKLTGVQMDGADVDEENYTLTEGSTIVTFKAEYLETLSVGEHTVTLLYTDSQVESKLEIFAAAEDNSDDNSTSMEKDDSADEVETTSTEQEAAEENSVTQPSSVQSTAAPTGDSQNILLWLVVLGMLAMLACSKKTPKQYATRREGRKL